MSCPHSVDNFESLVTPESGLGAKAEVLLGQKLPPNFISNQNPYAPLDFSKAPQLKAVYVATLVFRADFYGTVMARLLAYHADHGAVVNVLTTGYMMLDKDKALLRPLTKLHPNFYLDEFKYNDPGSPLHQAANIVNDKFRDTHIKLFITLSDHKNSDNVVIFGGRNIHDGFLFTTQPDYSKYPKLVQYGKDDSFVHWNDFEAKVKSLELANTVASHLQRFLDRNKPTQMMRPFAIDEPNLTGEGQPGGTFRHFISVPYVDDHFLEKQYVKMIDSAQSTIKISSPYLRPTTQIMAALKRASKRKVDITIQTRVELKGDTQAWLYEEVNKESINALYQDARIYKWTENSILHSKFLLIDGKVALLGSVNLSRRSFVQDVENGFVIQSGAIVRGMESIFDSYVSRSERISEPLLRKEAPTVVIRMLENQF